LAFAAEIKTLGGLLNSKQNRNKILIEHKETLIQIVSLMNRKLTDVILLTAVCKFAEDLLECPEIRDCKENMQPYYD